MVILCEALVRGKRGEKCFREVEVSEFLASESKNMSMSEAKGLHFRGSLTGMLH